MGRLIDNHGSREVEKACSTETEIKVLMGNLELRKHLILSINIYLYRALLSQKASTSRKKKKNIASYKEMYKSKTVKGLIKDKRSSTSDKAN